MKYFIIFTIVLAIMLVVVTKLLGPPLGIFIVSLAACLLFDILKKENKI